MSIVEDLRKLHFSIRGALVVLLFIAPFWYLDVYLFAPDFFREAPVYIPIVLAFCLTICSAVIYFLIGFAWLTICLVKIDVNLEKSEFPIIASTVLIGVGLSASVTFIAYKEHWKFMTLMYANLGLMLAIFLMSAFFFMSVVKKDVQAKKNEKAKT